MTLQGTTRAMAAGLASLVLTMATAILPLASAGCSSGGRAMTPTAPTAPVLANEVIGTLVAVRDDRPVDGGVDLTLELRPGVRVLARAPALYGNPPDQSMLAIYAVVNAAKLGDRLRARGPLDESGALMLEALEFVLP